jgi:hypothetical protein
LRRNPSSRLSAFFLLILLCRLFIPAHVYASVTPLETSSSAPSDVKTPLTLEWKVANKQLPLVDLPEHLLPDFDFRDKWTRAATRKTKTWRLKGYEAQVFAHANFSNSPAFGAVKAIPKNATTPSYTPQMANCDRMLASIFGGPAAVAAANGFEPAGLAKISPLTMKATG